MTSAGMVWVAVEPGCLAAVQDFVARSIFKVDAVADNPAVDLQGRGKGGGEDRVA